MPRNACCNAIHATAIIFTASKRKKKEKKRRWWSSDAAVVAECLPAYHLLVHRIYLYIQTLRDDYGEIVNDDEDEASQQAKKGCLILTRPTHAFISLVNYLYQKLVELSCA